MGRASHDSGAHAAPSRPIVAIGGSAGGLEAFRQLFAHLPADTGLAFIVIQHLDPERPSMLASVLASDIRMPVVEVAEGMRIEPNRVYVIPSDADLSIRSGVLGLVPRQQTGKLHLPIDSFFRALAEDQPGRAIGVVVSGAGSDGTEGLRAIKAAGGITLVQDPSSAQFRSMPESAIAAGVVDFRAAPEVIAQELVRLSRHPYVTEEGAEVSRAPAEVAAVSSILAAVQREARLDFTGYKRPTLVRRISRRMALRRLGSIAEYAEALRDNPGEARALAEDLLIHVTSFFRDPAAFDALARQVLPEIVGRKGADGTIRVWVPGCATGEEAYSIAICLLEVLAKEGRECPIKIFGSDLSDTAIDKARSGLYSEAEVEGVSQERLARYFERSDGRYRIGKQVRDRCVFVRHDLTFDPPFARLDLISCRNVLIYFDVELQRRVLSLLHHCLNRPGYLFLGGSESIGVFGELFTPVDDGQRLFLKTGESPRLDYPLALGREAESKLHRPQLVPPPQQARDVLRQADHLLLAEYAPPGVVVDERFEVVQFRGRTGEYLEAPPGQPQMNVLKMARDGLVVPLREALETARTRSVTVRRPGLQVRVGAQTHVTDLEVVPLAGLGDATRRYFLIVFAPLASADSPAVVAPPAKPLAGSEAEELAQLRADLTATRDYLQALTREHQETTEELAAANEELVAANEELQSTNEELQSAKEELQSTNEELKTVNDELRSRNQQLDVLASDLVNILDSVQLPVIIVDQALRLRRFTPTARDVASLVPGDVGRSIDDVKLRVEVDDLPERIRAVIETVAAKEWEVQSVDGRWYRMQIRPYRTTDNRLDGAVLSFVDVDVLKRALRDAEIARDYSKGIVETVPTALAVLDSDLRIVSANPSFHQSFAVAQAPLEGVPLLELAGGAWEGPDLHEAIRAVLTARTRFRSLQVRRELPGGGHRDLSISGSPIQLTTGELVVLLAIEDVTERRMLEASEKQARIEAEQANRAKDLFLATLSHELRTPLSSIMMSAQVLDTAAKDDPRIQRASAAIVRAVSNQARLIDDLLDISRIVSGKLMLDLQAVDLATVVQSAVDIASGAARSKGITLELTIHGELGPVHGDPMRLQQVVANLVNNAIKFTPPGGKIWTRLEATDARAELTVTDTGIGLRADMIPHLFDRFVQAETAMTRSHGGLGLGLAIVRHLVHVHGGEVSAESPGEGRGATFRVTLPLAAVGSAPVRSAPRAVVRSIAGLRVLLIEDDDDTREACATMLTARGVMVRAVASVAEGLAEVDAFAPQVILSDLAMPGADGYAFIRELRRRPPDRGGKTPVAALTALASEDDRRRCLEEGVQMHLPKPIDADRLAVAIGTLALEASSAEARQQPSPS